MRHVYTDPNASEDGKSAFRRLRHRDLRPAYQALFDLASDYRNRRLVSLEAISTFISIIVDLCGGGNMKAARLKGALQVEKI